VHPGVAAAVIAAAGPEVQEAADSGLAAFWRAVANQTSQQKDGEDSGLVVRAGLAAAPYLLRRGDWDTAGALLEHAVIRDKSPGTVQAALPALRRIAAATGTPAATGRLARALSRVDPGEAERLMRATQDAAASAGEYQNAFAAAGDLTNLLRDAGRLAEALEAAGQAADYTRRAGLGPWTQLLDQARRLQVLGRMGEYARVLAEVDRLRAAMAELPARPADTEAVIPWNVRELILSVGHTSALATRDWQRCLDLNAEVVSSKRERGAGVHDVTRTRFNDAPPLIQLGRVVEAGRLLADCQRVFEDHADTAALATVLSTRAGLEDKLGRRQAAADLERAALRLYYARPEPQDVAISHHNLAVYLGRLGVDRTGQWAHWLTAALIYWLAGMAHDLAATVSSLAGELRADDGGEALPSTVAEVAAVAQLTEGVRLSELLAALQPDPRVVEAALAEILAAAVALPPGDNTPDITSFLQNWEPVIAAIAAACQPGQEASAELLQFLDGGAKERGWAPLAAVLRRILDGERGDSLLGGLDEISAAIARETLARLGQEP
jgi:tetratricopeptide (TPR) repeat protein